MPTLKEVFKQIYQVGFDKQNFDEWFERWDGTEELLEVIEKYLIDHCPVVDENKFKIEFK